MDILVLIPYLYDTAPGQRFRIEQWARWLEPQGVRCHFDAFESPVLHRVLHAPDVPPMRKVAELAGCLAGRVRRLRALVRRQRWDVVFVYRELLPIGPAWLEPLLARSGIPIVYDFDDSIFLPHVTEENRRFMWLKCEEKTGAICRLSAWVTVGNAYLQHYALRYSSRVSMIPTTVDTDTYLPKTSTEVHEVPVIGWSGSRTTAPQLRLIEPALRTLARIRPFRLKVFGDPRWTSEDLAVESRAWDPTVELDELRSFDIGVMPLPDDPWSRGKCGLKALQYMALGVPTIASPVGVNGEIIEDGRNGFLASTQSEWAEKLSRLMTEAALRRRFAIEGRRTVEERYSARVQAPRLLGLFEQICGRRAQPRAPSAALEPALSIAAAPEGS